MIRCFFHQNALRRHFDDAAPLPQKTLAHLETCVECCAIAATHERLGKSVKPTLEASPFLRARIMSAIEFPDAAARSASAPGLRRNAWTAAPVALALVIFLSLSRTEKEPPIQSTAVQTAPQWKIAPFKAPSLTVEQPLETELASLRADTMNAARALAANFLPTDFSR